MFLTGGDFCGAKALQHHFWHLHPAFGFGTNTHAQLARAIFLPPTASDRSRCSAFLINKCLPSRTAIPCRPYQNDNDSSKVGLVSDLDSNAHNHNTPVRIPHCDHCSPVLPFPIGPGGHGRDAFSSTIPLHPFAAPLLSRRSCRPTANSRTSLQSTNMPATMLRYTLHAHFARLARPSLQLTQTSRFTWMPLATSFFFL